MADAHGSGPCIRKDVWVQIPPAAQKLIGNKINKIKKILLKL